MNERHVDEIVKDFDVRFLNVVKVSRRNGKNYVFDGQHTMEAVAQKSGARDTPVRCQVYCDLDYQDEAKIVADQDEHSKPLSGYEKWKAYIEAGDVKQREINELVQSFQLPISRSGLKRGVCVRKRGRDKWVTEHMKEVAGELWSVPIMKRRMCGYTPLRCRKRRNRRWIISAQNGISPLMIWLEAF